MKDKKDMLMLAWAYLGVIVATVYFSINMIPAEGYGLTDGTTGSAVYYDQLGVISGVEDQILLVSRFPTQEEIEKNTYIPFQNLEQCLTHQEVVMYHLETCPHCRNQLSMFENTEELNLIECREHPEVCQLKQINAVPTWEIKGKYYQGVRSTEELANIAGCTLT